MIKIGELARRTGLPISTLRHYAKEGLLGLPRKTARNMAWYPRGAADRVSLIRRLQEEFFLPLSLIGKLLGGITPTDDPDDEDLDLILDIRARLADFRSVLLPELPPIPRAAVRRLSLTDGELALLEDAGLVEPLAVDGRPHYTELDYRIVKALSDAKDSGFDPAHGFGPGDVLIYVDGVRRLARAEVRAFARHMSDEEGGEIAELVSRGIPAVNRMIGALHGKFVLQELGALRHRSAPDEGDQP